MKKIYFLLVTFLATLTSLPALADTGDKLSSLDNLSNSKLYALNCSRSAIYSGDDKVVAGKTALDETYTNTTQQFAIYKYNDTYYLWSVTKEKFVIQSGTDLVYADAPTNSFKITAGTATSGTWHFTNTSGDHLNINDEGNITVNWWSTHDAGNQFYITEVGDLTADMETKIDTYINCYTTYTHASLFLSAYSNGQDNYFCTADAYSALKTAYDTYGTTYTTEAQAAVKAACLTFGAAILPGIADNTHFVLQNKLHTTLYPFAASDNKIGNGSAYDSPAYLWTIKKTGDGTVKLYNEYIQKYIGATPTKNDVRYPMVDKEENAGNFCIINSGADTYNICIVDINFSDKTYNAMHGVNWKDGTNGVVRWDTTSDASKWAIKTELTDDLVTWTNCLKDSINETGKYVGDYIASDAVASALTDLANATVDNYVSAYKAVETAFASGDMTAPEEGKYYTIKVARNTYSKGHVLVEAYDADTNENTGGCNALQHVTNPDNIVPGLWSFEKTATEGQYYIKAANTGSYISKTNGTSYHIRLVASDSEDKGTYTYTDKSSVDVEHAVSLKDVNANNLMSARNADSDVVAWNAGNDGSGNNFYIQVATEIPVTIGTTGYATINLPCAVTLPDGLKAFTGTKGETEVTLTEVTGTIPAQTPVLLQGTASTDYTLTIDYTNTEAAPTDNAFSGTLAAASVGEGAYILKKGTNGIAFYPINKDSDTTVPANKAYLPSGTSPVIAFNFGNTTGISTIATDASESNTYYDLNGRRVFYPTKGIYVKCNGQKVFIK